MVVIGGVGGHGGGRETHSARTLAVVPPLTSLNSPSGPPHACASTSSGQQGVVTIIIISLPPPAPIVPPITAHTRCKTGAHKHKHTQTQHTTRSTRATTRPAPTCPPQPLPKAKILRPWCQWEQNGMPWMPWYVMQNVMDINSPTGTRTRVARVRAEYANRLHHGGRPEYHMMLVRAAAKT